MFRIFITHLWRIVYICTIFNRARKREMPINLSETNNNYTITDES